MLVYSVTRITDFLWTPRYIYGMGFFETLFMTALAIGAFFVTVLVTQL